MTFAPTRSAYHGRLTKTPGKVPERIPFAGRGEDFDRLTDVGLRAAVNNPDSVFGAVLALLVGCRSEPWAADSERRGASCAQVQAVADAAGLGEEEAEKWERIAESTPLSKRHVLRILGSSTQDAA